MKSIKRLLIKASFAANLLLIPLIALLAFDGFSLLKFSSEQLRATQQRVQTNFPVSEGDVVFLGDELTAGAPVAEMFPDVMVKNRGIIWDTTEDVLFRLPAIIDGKPNKIFLQVGASDIAAGLPMSTIVANYREIVARIVGGSPHTDIYIQSVLGHDSRSEKTRIAVTELNVALRNIAEQRQLVFIDLHATPGGLDAELMRAAAVQEETQLTPSLAFNASRIIKNQNRPATAIHYERWQSMVAPYVGEQAAAKR